MSQIVLDHHTKLTQTNVMIYMTKIDYCSIVQLMAQDQLVTNCAILVCAEILSKKKLKRDLYGPSFIIVG